MKFTNLAGTYRGEYHPIHMSVRSDYVLFMISCCHHGHDKPFQHDSKLIVDETVKAGRKKLLVVGGCCDYCPSYEQPLREAAKTAGVHYQWRLREEPCILTDDLPEGYWLTDFMKKVPENWKSTVAWMRRTKVQVV